MKKPARNSEPGTPREFQFHEYHDSAGGVNVLLATVVSQLESGLGPLKLPSWAQRPSFNFTNSLIWW
jgi:hypothetical protein